MEFKPVVFTVGNQEYGIDIELVEEIEKVQDIVQVPNSNADIKGIINLRGSVIPIYSLRHHFNLEEVNQTEESKFIVVNTGGMRIALEVEKVEEIQEVNESMIHDIPPIVKSDGTKYADKVINVNGKLIIVLNIEHLFSPEQLHDIKKFVEDIKE